MAEGDYSVDLVVRGSRPAKPAVSIVIPVLNEVDMTAQCLESIERHTDSPDHEVIVVNNGSTDGTREYLDSLEGVVALHCSRNIGVGRAWNLGIEHSVGDFICVMNNDIVVTPDWLEHLLWPFAEDERIWCTGPVFTRGPVPADFHLLADFVGRSEPRLVLGGIVGFCFVLKRVAVEEIGLFDEQFEIAWYEDTDYYCRLMQAGHPPALATNCLIHHYETWTARKELRADTRRIIDQNRRRFERKWGRVLDPGRDLFYTLPHGDVVLRQPAPGVLDAG